MPLVDIFSRSYWGFGGLVKEPLLVMVIHKYIGGISYQVQRVPAIFRYNGLL